MSNFITSADAILILTFNDEAPVQVTNWSSDRSWEFEDQEITETKMSIDGHLNAGFIPRPVDMNLSLSPNSNSLDLFTDAIAISQNTRRPFKIGGELTFPSLKKRHVFSNGYIIKITPVASGGTVLEAQGIHLQFERITTVRI